VGASQGRPSVTIAFMRTEVSSWARAALDHVAEVATGGLLDLSMPVTINFHPERLIGGESVLRRIGRDKVYRSQFESGISNGGLTAAPGGDRWNWEKRIFGGAYDEAPAAERPKYGALNHRRRSLGAAPRFGSAHLRLSATVLARTTFCFPDSVLEPHDFATAERFDLLRLADEFDQVERTDLVEATEGGQLDDYIEAHVHGVLDLTCDVEALVLDPSFQDTEIEDDAAALGVPVEWHEGRRLSLAELDRHPEFRGPHIVAVGHRVAEHDAIDAAVIGRATARGLEDPGELKRLWHYVARFGGSSASPQD
jgi:hypothetical protein